jgi:hypothetical protein
MSPGRRMGRLLLRAALDRCARRRVLGTARWLEINHRPEPRAIPDHAEPESKPTSPNGSTN